MNKLRTLITINGILDENGKEYTRKLRFCFNENVITVKELIDDVFKKLNLIEKYKLLNVKSFDEKFNKNLEILDLNELVWDFSKYTFNVNLKKEKVRYIYIVLL